MRSFIEAMLTILAIVAVLLALFASYLALFFVGVRLIWFRPQ